jgi:hypothetical protein
MTESNDSIGAVRTDYTEKPEATLPRLAKSSRLYNITSPIPSCCRSQSSPRKPRSTPH